MLNPLSNYGFGMSHRNSWTFPSKRPALRQIQFGLVLFVLLIGTTTTSVTCHLNVYGPVQLSINKSHSFNIHLTFVTFHIYNPSTTILFFNKIRITAFNITLKYITNGLNNFYVFCLKHVCALNAIEYF